MTAANALTTLGNASLHTLAHAKLQARVSLAQHTHPELAATVSTYERGLRHLKGM